MRKFEDTESAYREIEALSKIDSLFLKCGSAYIYEKVMKIIISNIRPTSPSAWRPTEHYRLDSRDQL